MLLKYFLFFVNLIIVYSFSSQTLHLQKKSFNYISYNKLYKNSLSNRLLLISNKSILKSCINEYDNHINKINKFDNAKLHIINIIFEFSLFRIVLANLARLLIANNAKKYNYDWEYNVNKWQSRNNELQLIYNNITNKNINYQNYYNKQFHAYEDGNLNWKAAYEVDSATYALTLRYWNEKVLSGKYNIIQIQDLLRYNILNEIDKYMVNIKKPEYICDLGCSTGISTEYIYEYYKSNIKSLIGIDLSPYFLSIANLRLIDSINISKNITYKHDYAENTHNIIGLNSTNLIISQFLFHELPTHISREILKSIYISLTSGGVIAISDIDVTRMLKNTAPINVALFQITEPYFIDYAKFDFKKELELLNFTDIKIVETDPKNRLILAKKI
tara:strand:+ start:140 stop:1303 length:1164 start_codon:yes stop_codon:yes gene_type:complete